MNEEGAKKTTFFSKNQFECPLCETKFYKEDPLTGGGRMIAGNLTRDLRRLYEPSKKFGEVFPLAYAVVVCPGCLLSAYPQDFFALPEKARAGLAADAERRAKSLLPVFDALDFTEARGLKEGAASYFYAIMCYDHFPKEYAPTIKQGISALRTAWILGDLHRKYPSENYDFLALNFYRKARFFYNLAVEKEQTGKESMAAAKNLGPDLDKNYGYDGVLYLQGLFEFLHGSRQDPAKRIESLTRAKRSVAKIFGMGRASKNKPTVLLDRARDLYADMTKELEAAGIKAVSPEDDAADDRT
jgi:uncharacterized protein (DUF2225 family)